MDKSKIKILIFGGGAIGSHLTYCLASKKTKVWGNKSKTNKN